MKKKNLLVFFLVVLLLISFTACGNDDKKTMEPEGSEKNFMIGCMAITEPVVEIVKDIIEPKGYDLGIVLFDGNHLPAVALQEGNIDGLINNFLPWLKTYNEENKADLVMVEPYTYYTFFAVYSSKHKSIEEIPQNAIIAIPGDPSNMDRSLRGLQDVGLISLDEKMGKFYSLLDVKDNPKNIKILETEISSTVRSINDVDAILTTSSIMKMAGFDPNDYLYVDEESTQFPVSLVVQPKDVEADWVKAFMDATQTDEFKIRFNDVYGGAYKLFNDIE